MKFFVAIAFLFLSPLLASIASASDPFGNTGSDFLRVEEAYQVSLEVKNDTLTATWDIADGYYLYRDKFLMEAYFEDSQIELPTEYQPGKLQFDEYFGKELEIYYQSTQLNAALEDIPQQFVLKIKSQGCADAGLCYAPRSQYFQIDRQFGTAIETDKSVIAPSSGGASGQPGSNDPTSAADSGGQFFNFWMYALFAIGGGLILNLMPCVFPVLSLKALSFAASSGSSHSHHLHGWAYTAGVIASFMIAAGLILLAKTAGEQTGWGFQLQYPPFIAALTYLFLIMGLSLSGMIHFGTSLMGVGQGLTTQPGYRGSFFTGVLAALVASPCTGPLMAPALGFALSQPPVKAVSIFIALGFGMALPFLLLSYSPRLAKVLPRPGLWMEKLKEILAFPMYLTAAWLLFVFGRQVGMLGVFYLLIGAVGLVFAVWLFQNLPKRNDLRYFVQALGISVIVLASYTVVRSEDFKVIAGQDPWQPYSKALVQQLREGGQVVLVDFTADWCITCKVNERIALSRRGFLQAVEDHNVALVKGDWTNEDPKISAVLNEFNRSGVPLYLVYPADTNEPPLILPQLLTQGLVIDALRTASGANNLVRQ